MSDGTGARLEVTVIGAGVIGLTCAHALREAGYRVTVIAADKPRVSEVAGGLWLPYAAGDGDGDEVMRWALETELPAGYDHGWVLRVPLVEMPAHLRALEPTRAVRRTVTSLDEVAGLVVNCSGLAARELAGDPTVNAARGQVVYLTRLAGVPCICDEDEMIYVLPRNDCTVVGGSYQPGNENEAVDPAETESLLARARALVRN